MVRFIDFFVRKKTKTLLKIISAIRNISTANVIIQPTIRSFDEEDEFNFIQDAKFTALLSDFAAIKFDRKLMILQNRLTSDSGINNSSTDEGRGQRLGANGELYATEIKHIKDPKMDHWFMFDLKCIINITLKLFASIGKGPGDAADINVALKDLESLILNEDKRPLSIKYLREHILFMTEAESHKLVHDTFAGLGYRRWRKQFSKGQLKLIDVAGEELFAKTFQNDWRQHFDDVTMSIIKNGFTNKWAFGGNDYQRFMSFGFILMKHREDSTQMRKALNLAFPQRDEKLKTAEDVTRYLVKMVPGLRKFCAQLRELQQMSA